VTQSTFSTVTRELAKKQERKGHLSLMVTMVTQIHSTVLNPLYPFTPSSLFLFRKDKKNTVTTVTTVTNSIKINTYKVTVRKCDRHHCHPFVSSEYKRKNMKI
jgi:hypothetical protein